MARYTGNHCPVCEQEFKDEDDIVVCPDCGTPYHRDCWKKIGVCMHRQEHAAGFEWKSELSAENQMAAVCPNCGTHNAPGARFCNHCGVPLPESPTQANARAQDGTDKQDGAGAPIYTRGSAPRRDAQADDPRFSGYTAQEDGGIYRKEVGPDDPIDGIKAKDWAAFVGRSPMYYLMQFFRISETKRRATISFSAFLFGSAYFFYRKMWKAGLLNALLELLLCVPSMLIILAEFNPSLLGNLPLGWLPAASYAAEVGVIVLRVVRSLFAVYWYKQTAQARIESVYAQYPEGDGRTAALAQCGGTNFLYAVLFVGIWMLIGVGFTYLAGPDYMRYLMTWAQM